MTSAVGKKKKFKNIKEVMLYVLKLKGPIVSRNVASLDVASLLKSQNVCTNNTNKASTALPSEVGMA